jgi:multidrug efflux system membrane fusion protein
VNAQLLVDTLRDVVKAPTAAIQRGEPGTFVYAIGDDGVVHVRPVKLGPQDGSMVAVMSGLNGGERVVVDGADRLRDGARVVVPKPAAGGTGSAGTRPGGDDGSGADGEHKHHHKHDEAGGGAADQGKGGQGSAP